MAYLGFCLRGGVYIIGGYKLERGLRSGVFRISQRRGDERLAPIESRGELTIPASIAVRLNYEND